MQKLQYLDCFAEWDGETLRIGNDRVEREFRVCDGYLACGAMRAADGYVWGSFEQKNLLMTGRTDEMTVQMAEDDRDGMSEKHLKVTLHFASDEYDFDRVLRVFPQHPFVSTEIYVRRYTGALEKAEERKVNTALETEAQAGKAERARLDAVDVFPVPSKHIKVTEITLRDRTDENDRLVKTAEDAIYFRGKYRGKGNLFVIRDYMKGKALLIVREAPVTYGMLNPCECDLYQSGAYLQVCGTGFAPGDIEAYAEGYGCTVGLMNEDEVWALYKAYHRAQAAGNRRHVGCIMSNTWGDRSRDGAVCHDFILKELDVAHELGLDTLQIDDGWAKGLTANSVVENVSVWGRYYDQDPEFWAVNPGRFPHGLEPIVERAKQYGISLGLWFSPDATDDYKYWRRDADTVLELHRSYGIGWFKLDGICIESKAGEANYLRFLHAVREESGDKISFNQDITAQQRLGYLYESKYFGTLFVENRYTDWGNYYPHATLRNLWQLTQIFPPERFQFEVLNNRRNAQKYEDDPLAPQNYDIDYLFASVMAASPLIWMELQHLHKEDVERLSRIIGVYKQHRDAFRSAQIMPIGSMPDGTQFTGFRISMDERNGYLILLREWCEKDTACYTLEGVSGGTMKLKTLCANWDAPTEQVIAVNESGQIKVTVGKKFGYLFAQYTCE